jgi:hypothetical protein
MFSRLELVVGFSAETSTLPVQESDIKPFIFSPFDEARDRLQRVRAADFYSSIPFVYKRNHQSSG